MTRETEEATTYIKSNYAYTSETGLIFWKDSYPCKNAFNLELSRGYKGGRVLGKNYYTHRIAWLLYYGEWPKGNVDHINGLKTDNRIDNLRVVSQKENLRNKRMSKNNTSGFTGVYWHKKSQKWQVRIKVDGKNKHVGLFANFNEAVIARKQAEANFGFHPNHGKPVNNPDESYLR